jgi:hypothetical protein
MNLYKRLLSLLIIAFLSILLSATVYAVEAVINTSSAANGFVTVTLSDFAGKSIRVQTQKGNEKYNYTLINAVTNIPLQMGTGEYQIAVLEPVGDKAKVIASEKFSVASINELEMFKISNPQIDFASSTVAIPSYRTLTAGKASDPDKINAVYESIVTSFRYDDDLAAQITSGALRTYVPVIDTVYNAKRGICYGYSAVFGGALRSQGIATRMVMGYVPELGNGTILHAWNEVWMDGKWVPVDTTFDSAAALAGKSYTLATDRSKAVVAKYY